MAIWVPVTKRLPNKDDLQVNNEFIVMIKGAGNPTTLFFDNGSWRDEHGSYYSVTHWMPLPDPVDHFREVRKMVEEDKIAQMTEADRIRAMTDEELVELMMGGCPPTGIDACAETCTKCWLKWLQQPVDAIVLEDLCAKGEIKLQEENDNE